MKPRQYLFALVDGGGNVPPELHAVRRLIERGHAVTVLADDSVAPEVRSTGADFRRWVHAPNRTDRLPEHDPSRDWECKYPWQLVDRLVDTLLVGPAAGYACDVREAITRCQPSVVACSMFCLGGMLAAEAARLPYVVLIPNIYPLPARGLPPFGIGFGPARGLLGRWRDEIAQPHHRAPVGPQRPHGRQHAAAHVRSRATRTRVRSSAPRTPATRHDVARVRLSGDVAGRGPLRRPCSRRSGLVSGVTLDTACWRQPLVLVAMSSTFQDQIDSLRRVIAALGTLPVHGIVTTGPAIDPAALGAAPNVTVLARAPHREVLRHAAAVVTHGGHGTVVKALAAGVPMVLLPHGRDQGDTAVRVTARGAGIALKRTAQPEAIAAAVREVIQNPTFRASAQRLGESVRRDADDAALLRELEDIPVERSVGSTVGTAESLMKRMTAVALLVVLRRSRRLTTPALASALAGDKAAYVGGTIGRFNVPGAADRRARRHATCASFVFVPESSLHAAEPLSIDYESIRHLEFGQRTSRRVPLVVAAAAVLGPIGLVSLLGKEPCA